jgi:D-3-phosphoglycerate dehydrogenase / 2-oxoglutarate reductase
MQIKRVLITDDCHPLLIQGLQSWGFECDFQPEITPDATLSRIGQYAGLIINSKILVNEHFLTAAEQLKFIGRLGSGMEIVDQAACKRSGVMVVSSPEGNRNAVAEQALGMLLCLANNLVRADQQVRADIWQREANRGWELSGKTIGIIGFGHTGRSFAAKLAGMEMRVLVYDKYLPTGYAKTMNFVEEASDLNEIQRQADIISLHLPLTAETKHLVNRSFIESCQPGLVLMNTSRGACVNTLDVVEALEKSQLRGACLDVFENEKVPTRTEVERTIYQRLHRLENVVVTPHIAGWTHESKQKMAQTLLEKLAPYFGK